MATITMTVMMIKQGKVLEPQPRIALDRVELYIIVHTTDNDVPTWYNKYLLKHPVYKHATAKSSLIETTCNIKRKVS
jgi:hypothetical protein